MKKIKKSLSIILLSSIIWTLFISPMTYADTVFNNNLEKYQKTVDILTSKQEKESQKIEIELFLLQKNILKKYNGYYENLLNNMKENINETQKMLEDWNNWFFISNWNLKINSNEDSKKLMPKLNKDIELINTNISAKWKYSNWQDIMFSDIDIEWNINTLENSNNIDFKTSIESFEQKWSAIFNLKQLIIKEDFNYNPLFLEIFWIEEEEYNKNIMDIKNGINKLKLFYLYNKNKYLKINWEQYNTSYNMYLYSINSMYDEIKKEKINEKINQVMELVNQEKIFLVYKSWKDNWTKWQNHYLILNPLFIKEFYKITEIDLLDWKVITNSSISKMEKEWKNIINKLDNGLFTYKYIEKVEEDNNIMYSEFNKDTMVRFLVKNNNGDIFFLNKDTLKLMSWDEKFKMYWYITDNELKLNWEIKELDKKINYVVYSKNDHKNFYTTIKFEDKEYKWIMNWFYDITWDTNKIYINWNVSKINDMSDNKITFKLNSASELNKVWLEYWFNNKGIIPLNIDINGTILSKNTSWSWEIIIPKNISKEYQSITEFYQYFDNLWK